MELAFGIILLVLAVFLVIAVLLQQGKSSGLGAISGGNESYYGQGKAVTKDKILSRLTTIVAILFCIIVLVVFMLQGTDSTTDSATGDSSQVTTTEAHDHDHEESSPEAATETTTESSPEATTEPSTQAE